MKRDFLKEIGLTDEQINSVMQENGKDIEREKNKFADYDDLKNQLTTANETLDKFKDYDATKAEVEKYKTELEKAQKESASKIAKMELESRIKDFTSSKKFVNDETKEFYSGKLIDALSKDDAKGKSIDSIFEELTKEKTNIFMEENKPSAPVVAPMKDNANAKSAMSEMNAARAIMGLPPKN